MAKHLRNEACPKCRKVGHDRSGDNLAVYSDDSRYCWKCGYFRNGSNSIAEFLDKRNKPVPNKHRPLNLPDDCIPSYPNDVLEWLHKYQLTQSDIVKAGALYSQNGVTTKKGTFTRLLCFPFWQYTDNDMLLLGYQARVFGDGKEKCKWLSFGDVQTIVNILNNGVGHALIKTTRLVLVEDLISAIKVSRLGISAMPLFGVNIKSRIGQFRVLNPLELIIFLDPDQHKHSIEESNLLRLNGFKAHTVLSKKDPKEYTYDELKELLKVGQH